MEAVTSPVRDDDVTFEEAVAIAQRVFGQADNIQLLDARPWYVWHFSEPIRGGGTVLIDRTDGTFLYAGSAVTTDDLFAAFAAGTRTDPAELEPPSGPDELDRLHAAAMDALDRYKAVYVETKPGGPLPDASEMHVADQALYMAAIKLLPDGLDDAKQAVRDARANVYATDFAYGAEALLDACSDALWKLLLVGDDQPLPRVTIRACCPGKSCGSTTIILAREPDGLFSYRRLGNHDLFFGPGTLDELREGLRDTGRKP